MRQTNFNDYLFRCSSLGKLMTNSRSKTDPMSATAKTYLKDLHKEAVFNRRKEIQSKYLDKGIQVEEQSITLYSKVKDTLFIKNKERFNNEFITGEPDNKQGVVRDIKSSWSFDTFPLYDTEIPNKMYYWQLQGYMALTGLQSAELVYCLVDTPPVLIEDEKRRMSWKLGMLDLPDELSNEITTNMMYSDIPNDLRVKVFKVDYDPEAIEKLYERITLCREFLNNLSLELAKNLEVSHSDVIVG